MSAIGILGGMGPQASAHLQTLLIKNAPKHMNIASDSDFPEIILLSVPVPNFIHNAHNVRVAKSILIQRTKLLEAAGCSINGIACNTAHLLLPDLQAATNVPFVSIPHLVNERLIESGAQRVGLFATPNTLRSRLFDDALDKNITLIKPTFLIIKQLEQMIVRRLQADITNPDDAFLLRQLVESFVQTHSLDTVILGCTELPLIFGESGNPRVIDTLQVLSDGLLREFARMNRG